MPPETPDSSELTRDQAKAAGLLIDTCESCKDDIWKDRGEWVGSFRKWHKDCAEAAYQELAEALGLRD